MQRDYEAFVMEKGSDFREFLFGMGVNNVSAKPDFRINPVSKDAWQVFLFQEFPRDTHLYISRDLFIHRQYIAGLLIIYFASSGEPCAVQP